MVRFEKQQTIFMNKWAPLKHVQTSALFICLSLRAPKYDFETQEFEIIWVNIVAFKIIFNWFLISLLTMIPCYSLIFFSFTQNRGLNSSHWDTLSSTTVLMRRSLILFFTGCCIPNSPIVNHSNDTEWSLL